MYCDDASKNGDKRPGRPADLDLTTTECRDECAGDNRSSETLRRRHARGDAKTDRERQRDDAYRYASGQIAEKSPPIATVQTLDQFRLKKCIARVRLSVIPSEVEESLTIFC